MIILRILHIFTLKMSNFNDKKCKKCKINNRSFTYDGLTFSVSFLQETVKDGILNASGRI